MLRLKALRAGRTFAHVLWGVLCGAPMNTLFKDIRKAEKEIDKKVEKEKEIQD